MGSKNEPGQFDCYAKALPDEPMFVLLARDLSAPSKVEEWAAERKRDIVRGVHPQSDLQLVEDAQKCAADMRRWRVQNYGAWRTERLVPRYDEHLSDRFRDPPDFEHE